MGHFSDILRLGLLVSMLLVPKGNCIPTESILNTTTTDGIDQEVLQALPNEVLRQLIEMANITSRVFRSKTPMGKSDLSGGTQDNICVPSDVDSSVTAATADWSVIQRLLLSLWDSEAQKTSMKKELLQLKDELTKLKEENSKKAEEEIGVKEEGCPPCPIHHWHHCHHHHLTSTPLHPLSSNVRLSLEDSPVISWAKFQETQETILREIWDFKVHGINCNKFPKETETQKQDIMPRDCYEIFQWGARKSGVYTIYPQKDADPDVGVEVWCDMGESESHDEADLGTETEGGGGGWTVVIKRQPVAHPVNFNRGWRSYKDGFGTPETEYWIGNENLHALTSNGKPQALRVDITDWDGVSKYASYGTFSVGNEQSNYRLRVENFSTQSTAGDSLTQGPSQYILNDMPFSTFDNDNDNWVGSSCAKVLKSGMWFNRCHHASPTNPVFGKGISSDGMNWYSFYGDFTMMQFMTFKIRPSGIPGV